VSKEIITKILESQDLFELANRLEKFLGFLKDIQNHRNNILYELYDPLFSWYFDKSFYLKNPYIIFEGNEGIRLYLKNRWQFYNSYRKNRECLLTVISEIREKIIRPQGQRITVKEIESIMDTLDQKFSFVEKVIDKKHIEIVMLDHSHACWNNFTSISRINDIRYYRIITTHIRKESPHSEQYSFLHELGHILHFVLTDSFNALPEGFTKIQRIMFNQRDIPPSNEEMCELFADCFAIAAIYGSHLEKYDPYDMILDVDKAIITAYIMQLIGSIKT